MCDAKGPLVSIVPFTKLFYGVHSFLYYHGWHVEGITIIESFLSMRQGDLIGGFSFALTHYRTLLKTITHAPSCIFPSLANDTHIMGPLSEIIHVFYNLCTKLILIGLRVKVSKCNLWSPLGISPSIEILQGCILVIDGLPILNVPMGFQDFATHFLDEVLSQGMAHVNDLPLLGKAKVAFAICPHVQLVHLLISHGQYLFSSILSLLASFDKRIMQIHGDIMGRRSWEYFQNPLTRR